MGHMFHLKITTSNEKRFSISNTLCTMKYTFTLSYTKLNDKYAFFMALKYK